jgi:hypothetical protein
MSLFFKVSDRDGRNYYVRRGHGPVDLSRKTELMYRASLVTELDRDTGLLYYETPNSSPENLQKIIKNRWGSSGIIVAPSYIKRLLDNVEMNERHGMIGEYHIGPLPSFEDLG